MTYEESIKELMIIPGVGRSVATDLYDLGIRRVSDLKDKHPELLYRFSNELVGTTQDRCLLYTFRCAVYFARTPNPDSEKLKWWNWKDDELKT